MKKNNLKNSIILVLCLCLIGCGNSNGVAKPEVKTTESVSVETSSSKETVEETSTEEVTSVENLIESSTAIDEIVEQLRAENDKVLQASVIKTNWNQQDPNELKQLLENDETFINFVRSVIAHSLSYSSENPNGMLNCLFSSSIDFYGGIECFPFFDYPNVDSCYNYPASEIEWLAINIYNIKKADVDEKVNDLKQQWEATNKYGYTDGMIIVGAAGPAVNSYKSICGIEGLETAGEVLKVTFYEDIPQQGDIFTILPWGTDIDELEPSRVFYLDAEMGQIEVNGVKHWTLYSVSNDYR